MSKLAQTSVKYLVRARFEVDGLVEKPDVIGALFGQTEGLLGPELDLRELQRTGRIGRIEVVVKTEKGKSKGEITIPTSLNGTETTLIAASIETIDKIGPCSTKIKVADVEDLRTKKRAQIIDRAKGLLSDLLKDVPETSVITDEMMEDVRSAEIIEYKGFTAGPDVDTSDSLVLCEGRADVINLLKNGVTNALAIGGASVPREIIELCKEKEITVFLDGDRAGDLILKELRQIIEIDFIARAPEGKEVEELTKKEVFKALRDKIPAKQVPKARVERKEYPTKKYVERPMFKRPTTFKKPILNKDMQDFFKNQLNELIGTRAAAIYSRELKFEGRVPIKELGNSIRFVERPTTIIVDGIIDLDLVKLAERKGVQNLVGTKIKENLRSRSVNLLTVEDL